MLPLVWISKNMVRRFFCQHDDSRMGIAIDDLGHDRSVDDPQSLDSDDAALRIDHTVLIIS